MKTARDLSLTMLLALMTAACGDSSSQGRGTDIPRGLGKADGSSSCLDICGDQAAAGCWCDDTCELYGDCCGDKKQTCDQENACSHNDDCPTSQYCQFAVGGCESAMPLGQCADRPMTCDGTYDVAVCGCDKMTYYSRCEAAAAGVSLLSDDGHCPWEGSCSDSAHSHCFTEGYVCNTTGCGLGAAGLCEPMPSSCEQASYQPVCGCDAVTYANDCERLMLGVNKDHEGACTGNPCDAQDAAGEAGCPDSSLGYAWTGAGCEHLTGCACVGADCANLYWGQEPCELAHSACY